MILQQLHKDAGNILTQTGRKTAIPSMYVPKALRWVVELSTDPRVPPFIASRGEPDAKGKVRGLEHLLPECKRAGTVIRPFLLADTPAYALGLLFPDDLKDKDEARERARAAQKFAAFKKLLRECAAATDNADAAAVLQFLDTWNADAPPVPLPPDMSGAHTVTFRVDGKPFPVDDPAVRAWWAARGASDPSGGVAENGMQCLLTGARGPVEEIMPVPVKGIPGGQPTGTHLVSANFAAAESYGLKRAQTSPICRDAGEQFGKALNALLASETHHKALQSVVYVFWASAPETPTIFAFDPGASTEAVLGMMDAVRRGVPWCHLDNEDRFHIFGLSANAARAVVRSALDVSIKELGRAQAAWFRRLSILNADGEPGEPLGLKTLSVAPYREFKDIAPGVEDALVQAALGGNKLPQSLLSAVVSRCRADTERRVTYPRAALLKYILTQDEALEVAELMSEETTGALPGTLNEGPNGAAYHCGRLFAELEDIQRQALGGVNAPIGDKYFGSASASPASVFGILLAGAQNHLSDLRKNREGAWHGAQKRLEDILAQIVDFPKTLPLREQALFSLGYYHHRAAKRKDIAERVDAKKRAAQTTLDASQEEE